MEGFAADDGVAAHFIDEQISRVVSSRPNAKAYRVSRSRGGVEEIILDTEYIG